MFNGYDMSALTGIPILSILKSERIQDEHKNMNPKQKTYNFRDRASDTNARNPNVCNTGPSPM